MLEKTAIILLAYADFEAMEISLANYAKLMKPEYKMFILQNGRGTYDCERTYRVAKRYENLYPQNIKVIDTIPPQKPYFAIKELLNSEEMKEFDYICKVDDDVFPLNCNWLEKMIECYKKSKDKYGDDLGYVTGLVNNNPWGFKETLEIFNLEKEYFEKFAQSHIVGAYDDSDEPVRIAEKDEIYTGWGGTIWRNPYISRWLHKKTTFYPEKFVKLTKDLGFKEVDNTKRYSINCMLFEKDMWNRIEADSDDDEFLFLKYCRENNKKIVSDLSNPFVHLCFFTQREENRDLLPKIRKFYEKYLDLPFPISMCPNKEYENENRLRFLESTLLNKTRDIHEENFLRIINNENNMDKRIVLWGASIFLKNIITKYDIKNPNIIGVVDKNEKMQGNKVGKFTIENPDIILELKPDVILISIVHKIDERYADVKQFVEKNNLKDTKIYFV